MNYVTVLITRTHRELLQLQTRRQAHLPLADVEEVVAGRLARPVDRGERMRAVVVEQRRRRRNWNVSESNVLAKQVSGRLARRVMDHRSIISFRETRNAVKRPRLSIFESRVHTLS